MAVGDLNNHSVDVKPADAKVMEVDRLGALNLEVNGLFVGARLVSHLGLVMRS